MATDIEMCSNALILLGDNPISSFSEAGFGATAANNLYTSTYEDMLSSHPWGFALKEQKLNQLAQTPDPETGYTYAYQLPTDLLRIWKLMDHSDYVIIGDILYSNLNSILLRYVYKVEESQLPAYFVKAMEYQLASEFAVFISEDSGTAGLYEMKARDKLAQAQTIDSQNRPQQGIIDSPFADVRFGAVGYYNGAS
jgi:hypothetical protein